MFYPYLISSKKFPDHLILDCAVMKENKKFTHRIQNFSRINRSKRSGQEIDPLIPVIVRMLKNTVEDELSCDEVLELVDQYAELASKNEAAAALFPLIRLHLDRCHDCLEEYEALQRILESFE
jgi:hypothetical protein